MKKRPLFSPLIACLALSAMAASGSPALAEVENVSIPVEIAFDVPCVNGGAGETVVLTGDLHFLVSTTLNGNIARTKFHFQPQGISGYGSITGDKYQGTGVTQGQLKSSLENGQASVTMINNFRIIGQGPGNNFLVHENTHLTINANGDVTAFVDNFTADCK